MIAKKNKRVLKGNAIYFFGALGGLLFGYDTGVISGAIIFIQEDMHFDEWIKGIVVSTVLFGAAVGAIIIGKLADVYGRKQMVQLTAVIFFIGALLSALSPNYEVLAVSRVVLGLAVGGASATVPVYLAEMAPAKRRGSLSGLNQLMIIIGIFLAYVVNYAFHGTLNGWRIMLGLAAAPAVILFFGVFAMPASPRLLVEKGNINAAYEILKNIRPSEQVAKAELEEIKETVAIETGGSRSIKSLFSKNIRPALVAAVGLAVFQQIMGCNVVLYYTPTIMQQIGISNSNAVVSSLYIGGAMVVATVLSLFVVDKMNRKAVLSVGSAGMSVCLLIVSVIGFADVESEYINLLMAGLVGYIVFFAMSWGPVMWIMLGEMFPTSYRGTAVGFSSTVNWSSNFLVGLFFPPLLASWGNGPTFLTLALICAAALIFVRFCLFETRGRTLEDIERTLMIKSVK
jgi:sugar porter (SP) family MFS transporter